MTLGAAALSWIPMSPTRDSDLARKRVGVVAEAGVGAGAVGGERPERVGNVTRRTILGMMLSIMPVEFVVSVIPPMGAISPAQRFIPRWLAGIGCSTKFARFAVTG